LADRQPGELAGSHVHRLAYRPIFINLVSEEDHGGGDVKVAGRLNEASGKGCHQERPQGLINRSNQDPML
jgi:hypothetical protein